MSNVPRGTLRCSRLCPSSLVPIYSPSRISYDDALAGIPSWGPSEYMNAAAITHRTLAPIDLIIIGIYFLIIFSIGLYFALKERTSTDYFLASRNIGWFAIGASLFVSNIS